MSDISIPGVTGKVDTKSMIDALMDVERAKLAHKKEEVQSLKNEKDVWQDVQSRLSKLQTAAKKLYGFQNPFNEKLAVSTDETVLTATAGREAYIETRSFRVDSIATADRFRSRSLDKNFSAPAGTYRFLVGEDAISFSFGGGSLTELVETINRKGGKLLAANLIKDTTDTRILIIEAKKTGAASKLVFEDTALEFGLDSGMLIMTQKTSRDVALDSTLKTALPPDLYTLQEGRLTLEASSGEVRLPLAPPFILNPNMVLELDVEIEALSEEPWETLSPPSGPEILPPGEAEFQDIRIQNERSLFLEPPWEPPEPPEKVEDPRALSAGSGSRLLDLPDIDLSPGTRTIRISLGELVEKLDFLVFRNRNTYRRLSFSNVRIFDPTARGDHKPAHALAEAGDAVIEMDGVTVRRSGNEIDDLLPGVKVTLHSVGEQPVRLAVQRDRELIKNDIIEFVGYYNRVLTLIDIVSRNDPTVIEDATFFTEEEKAAAEENLGLLQGNFTLSQIKNRLRTITLSAYNTAAGGELALLVQMGVATDTAGPGGGLDKSRLRGYLDIDEAKLDEALTRFPEAAKELFGMDSDGDFVVDSGVAFAVDENTRPLASSGGIIEGTARTLTTMIDRRNGEIDDFNMWLEDYEADLKRKFGMMEGALQSLEDSSRAIENFNRSSQE